MDLHPNVLDSENIESCYTGQSRLYSGLILRQPKYLHIRPIPRPFRVRLYVDMYCKPVCAISSSAYLVMSFFRPDHSSNLLNLRVDAARVLWKTKNKNLKWREKAPPAPSVLHIPYISEQVTGDDVLRVDKGRD